MHQFQSSYFHLFVDLIGHITFKICAFSTKILVLAKTIKYSCNK